MSLDSIYPRLPKWAQHAAVSTYGLYWYRLRFGGDYEREVRAYRARERFTADEWAGYQQAQLVEVLTAAAGHVPFYREAWGAAARAAARSGRLADIPLLEKDAVRADPRAFLRSDMRPRKPKTFHTSGSTGTPIATMWTVDEIRRSRAVREVRSNNWAGVSFTQPRATFSGRMVEPDPDSSGPYYRFNLVERQVYFSPFHLRPDTAERYVRALRRHGTVWLSGYAVSFYTLARMMLEGGLAAPPTLRAVITTSEKVTPEMREVMEQGLGCRVFEEYSTVENIMLATECEAGSLHVSPDVGIVEILRPDGTACQPGEVGEVVATGLMRRWQPLIRYRLGDLAAWREGPCACGRAMPVLQEVVGRLEDAVIGPDGRELVRFHGLFVKQPHVREGQVIQERLDLIRVKIVPTPDFTPADVQDIEHRVHARLGTGVQVIVETVPSIPRTAAGKFKAVISHVKRPAAAVPAGVEEESSAT